MKTRNSIGRVEQRILAFFRDAKRRGRKNIADSEIADRIGCSLQRVVQVRAKHNIPNCNIMELGFAAHRAGLTLTDIRALASQPSAVATSELQSDGCPANMSRRSSFYSP